MHFHTLLNQMLSYHSHVLKSSNYDEKRCVMNVKIVPRKNGLRFCSKCHSVASKHYDTLPERDFEFIPYCGMRVVFKYAMRRLQCPQCGKILVEEVPWASGKSPVTNELKARLAEEAKDNDTSTVAKRNDVSWEAVDDSIHAAVEHGLNKRELRNVTQIGIDEVAWKKGHNYITLVYQLNPNERRLLWVGEGRSKQTLENFFDEMEKRSPGFAKQLRIACTDMWRPYTDVIAAKAPEAVNILDRFHIVKMANQAVDEIRNEEYRQLKDEYPHTLAHSKYCFLKNPENLTERQTIKLKELQRMNLKTNNAYLLKEQLRLLWEHCKSEEKASSFLEKWCVAAVNSGLKPMKKLVRTIRNKMELILNHFRVEGTPNSGIVEGLNRKVNLSIRKSYGFSSLKNAQDYLLHQLGNLEPLPFTHKFC